MKKIYIKFTRHTGSPRRFVYEFDGVKGFRDWYREEYSRRTGEYLPSNASIYDICGALRGDYSDVIRVARKDVDKYDSANNHDQNL